MLKQKLLTTENFQISFGLEKRFSHPQLMMMMMMIKSVLIMDSNKQVKNVTAKNSCYTRVILM
jgi:hypothetical protein